MLDRQMSVGSAPDIHCFAPHGRTGEATIGRDRTTRAPEFAQSSELAFRSGTNGIERHRGAVAQPGLSCNNFAHAKNVKRPHAGLPDE